MTYDYDAAGNQLAVTDPLGNTTSYAYDDLHRRVPLLACPAVSGSNVALLGKPAVAPGVAVSP